MLARPEESELVRRRAAVLTGFFFHVRWRLVGDVIVWTVVAGWAYEGFRVDREKKGAGHTHFVPPPQARAADTGSPLRLAQCLGSHWRCYDAIHQ
ncbi:hypothetical protein BDW02DRAFT_273818 [Decorospora gaudefroyi]|uniref:Uncharacterized protein n=1 Tax=Decorospora gaudefroyi TaxID=184978 RepID=A0A6A5KS64_9PLEO|nr:hypothetical protein BDW02DRAFT_273818 [Decorospora gaudefroyi]